MASIKKKKKLEKFAGTEQIRDFLFPTGKM
jgi:hypothetical protein